MTKQTKKEKGDNKIRSIIVSIIDGVAGGLFGGMIIIALMVFLFWWLGEMQITYAGMNILHNVNLWLYNMVAPTHTAYLSPTLFPLKVDINNYQVAPNPIKYIFYGTKQSNGTECISSVAVYSFNYTIQRFSPIPEIITNPKGVADAYYTSEGYLNVTIPNGYTLLCPNIINASKVI